MGIKLLSVEQNGETRFYELTESISAFELLSNHANPVSGFEPISSINRTFDYKHRIMNEPYKKITQITEPEYAEKQQSVDFDFSVDISIDCQMLSYYKMFEHCAEGNRDETNSRIVSYPFPFPVPDNFTANAEDYDHLFGKIVEISILSGADEDMLLAFGEDNLNDIFQISFFSNCNPQVIKTAIDERFKDIRSENRDLLVLEERARPYY